ncbi:hypothetical protein [Paenibacillus roseipurpureus]|uniref:Uncharacterized protein n=1 Tax=Paenibacillus roseopurpureus TaxID=2918901 RepID=A0AA96RNF9_9BACL|nr:hypothetical protein [Paenibacillus sp. MBLB1832]WNR45412.1 hypothetical protein MJB10_04560 [Paenibacillus sp. MBLB1832]
MIKQNKIAQELVVSETWIPPQWALLQRKLLESLNQSAVEFVNQYTREDGTLIWRDEWPGMDGSDDPYEGFMNLALLYALGGSDEVGELADRMWESITWQWTQYGQIYQEFDGYYDWMHHGEGYLYFYFLGLSRPNQLKNRQRAVKFAQLYMGNDPAVPNYDKEKKLIRSPITGSKGPRFVMTKEDWVTHRGVLDDYLAPFEDLPGVDFSSGTCRWSDDKIYSDLITKMNERQAKGDVPVNLNATSLLTHAYLFTGDESYRDWVLEYVTAWEERTVRNNGIMPDNIGLSGEIGEYNDGKWWGGFYGWRWPHGLLTIIEPVLNACMNAVLLTGDMARLGLVRSQLDYNWKLGKVVNGMWQVPYKHFDSGWTDFRVQVPTWPIYLWTVSMEQEDLERVKRVPLTEAYANIEVPGLSGRNDATMKETKHYISNTVPWFRYMQGEYPQYPEEILRANFRLIQLQLHKMRSQEGNPANWVTDGFTVNAMSSIHKWQEMCPVYFEGLLQLVWGTPMHISHGGLQHARVRYYDGIRKRPGLPEDVAALVEAIADESVTLNLVNLSLFNERVVIIQGGSFGEHAFTTVDMCNEEGILTGSHEVRGKWLPVRLGPGAGVQLKLGMKRYVNQPSYETPWSLKSTYAPLLQGRPQA